MSDYRCRRFMQGIKSEGARSIPAMFQDVLDTMVTAVFVVDAFGIKHAQTKHDFEKILITHTHPCYSDKKTPA